MHPSIDDRSHSHASNMKQGLFRSIVDKDEQVIWSGRPVPAKYGLYYGLWPLLCGVGLIASDFLVANMDLDRFNIYLTNELKFSCLCIGLALCAVPVLCALWAGRIRYAITSKRAIRMRGERVDSTPLKEIGFSEIQVNPLGIVSLFYKITFKESFSEGQYQAGLYPEGFIAIDQAKEVDRLLHAALTQFRDSDK